jgi:hypothetical protein
MRTVSRHMLRRTARAREQELERAQAAARSGTLGYRASELLHRYDVAVDDVLETKSFVRGPFGWRVIAR